MKKIYANSMVHAYRGIRKELTKEEVIKKYGNQGDFITSPVISKEGVIGMLECFVYNRWVTHPSGSGGWCDEITITWPQQGLD